MEDKRFAHIATDPKFRRIPKGERKVKIDKRFQSMFKDKKFKVKYTVDKRGRPVNHSTSEDLKRYYELSSESEDDSEDEETSTKDNKKVQQKQVKENKKQEKIKAQKDTKSKEKTKIVKGETNETSRKNTLQKKDKANGSQQGKKNSDQNKSTKSGKSLNDNKEDLNSDEESDDLTNSDDSEEEEDNESDLNSNDSVDVKNKVRKESKSDSLNQKIKGDKDIPNKVKKKLKNLKIDYARGEGKLLSDSSSDDESEEEEVSDSEGIDHKWGELDADAEQTEEVTRRLAACNMDWDRIRATDLMVLFSSFLPTGSRIESVKIYTSEFGKARMAEEDVKGPIELVESNEGDEETEEGAKYHMEKLRQYQLNRLKYYYAVVTCDTANTANKIYTECDGMEYESSATKIDLRFIPDEMDFDEEPKETCEKLPELGKYKPRFFTTTALQQAKVDLTWDETDPDRIEIAQKLASGKVDEISENDLQAYLASSSGEDEEEEEENKEVESDDETKNPIDKYKALLAEIEHKEKAKEKKDVGMEISWGIDLESKTEKLVKKKLEEQENKTPFQKYLDKRKEKRKLKKETKKQEDEGESNSDVPSDVDMNDPYFAEEFDKPEFKDKKKKNKEEKLVSDTEDEDEQRNAELELLLMNEDEESKKHFSLKQIQDGESESKMKKKRKKGKVSDNKVSKDDFKINVEDDRFSALFTSHHYNIDPTDSHFKKTKNMEVLINEKIKRRNFADDGPEPKKVKSGKKNAELSVLVKSVKRKAEAFANKK